MVVTQVASQSPTVTRRNCLLTNNRIYIEIKKTPHILVYTKNWYRYTIYPIGYLYSPQVFVMVIIRQ